MKSGAAPDLAVSADIPATEILDGFKSIEVAPDAVQFGGDFGGVAAPGSGPRHNRRSPTGARVTIEFVRREKVAAGDAVHLVYDLAGNGGIRACHGTALLTHVTACADAAPVYHYRFAYWIPAAEVMRLERRVPNLPRSVRSRTDTDAVRMQTPFPGARVAKSVAHPHENEN
jgi:hypothetical protein